MSKKVKEFEMTALRTALTGVKDFIALEPIKVDSATDYNFRKKLREKNIRAMMVKNALAKKIFAENGVTVDATWAGTTLVCWGADSVKALATSVDTAVKESKKDPKSPEKFKVKSAVADGQPVSFETAKTLPTRQEAIGEILAAILGPGSALAGCLTGAGSQVAGLVLAMEEKKQDAAPADAAPAAEAAPAV